MEVVNGARCWPESMTATELEDHGVHDVLYCAPCGVFVYPCCGEKHVCPKLDVEELADGEWVMTPEEMEARAAEHRAAAERSRSVREDLVVHRGGRYVERGADGLPSRMYIDPMLDPDGYAEQLEADYREAKAKRTEDPPPPWEEDDQGRVVEPVQTNLFGAEVGGDPA